MLPARFCCEFEIGWAQCGRVRLCCETVVVDRVSEKRINNRKEPQWPLLKDGHFPCFLGNQESCCEDVGVTVRARSRGIVRVSLMVTACSCVSQWTPPQLHVDERLCSKQLLTRQYWTNSHCVLYYGRAERPLPTVAPTLGSGIDVEVPHREFPTRNLATTTQVHTDEAASAFTIPRSKYLAAQPGKPEPGATGKKNKKRTKRRRKQKRTFSSCSAAAK